MTTIKTNDRDLVAVEVPVGAHGFEVDPRNDMLWFQVPPKDKEDLGTRTICFEHGVLFSSYAPVVYPNIIGLLSDLTEQQAAEYVRALPAFKVSSITGLTNLLQSHGLNTSAPILLIEKVK